MPRARRELSPLIRKFLKAGPAAPAGAGAHGPLQPAVRATGRDGAPVLGDGHVYVMKHGKEYHTEWCQTVADKWDHAPRGLLVTLLADVAALNRCQKCDRIFNAARASSAQGDPTQPHPVPAPLPPEAVIPLSVVGAAHGVLFLAAGPDYQELLQETTVEPATPLLVDGRRDGMVLRVDAARDEPLLVVQLDPRATLRNVPYQTRLRHPLQRSATKPYALECVEPAPRT